MEMPQVYRPIPRRTFEISPSSTESSHPPSPSPDSTNPELLTDGRGTDRSPPPSRTRSILNLTSSTLFGIYSPTGEEGTREELSTPWGTGAQTPSQRQSIDDYRPTKPPVRWNGETTKPHLRPRVRRKGFRAWLAPLALQTALLFTLGVGYGSIITHIQKTQQITPVPVPDAEHDSIWYHISWGIFGILLGNALPLVDTIWKNGGYASSEKSSTTGSGNLSDADSDEEESRSSSDSSLGPFWYSAVRSIGAFVGIAFAVRRLPWQSTLQASLTLALVNPVLWYLIDRSLPGFACSTVVSLLGTSVLLLVNPNFVPVPTIHQPMASEQFGVYTWLASILFCTSLCFGAIGRRLQL